MAKCLNLTMESGYIRGEKAEASLIRQGTDKVLNSGKTQKMKNILVKETTVGRFTASK